LLPQAHVCVLQTALDLLRKQYHVHVVVDAISSQQQTDREVALERMKQVPQLLTDLFAGECFWH
jgi:nicotinamidase-related amidase